METRIIRLLTTWGGPLLIVLGVVLIVAAFMLGDSRQVLAGTSLVMGVLIIVFGMLLPRLRGPFQLGPTGFSGVPDTIVERVAEEERLTPEERLDAVKVALDQVVSVPLIESRGTVIGPDVVERVVSHSVDAVLAKREESKPEDQTEGPTEN